MDAFLAVMGNVSHDAKACGKARGASAKHTNTEDDSGPREKRRRRVRAVPYCGEADDTADASPPRLDTVSSRSSGPTPSVADSLEQEDGGDDTLDVDESRACVGCGRTAKGGRCWVDPSASVSWAFAKSRGWWCRDCHSCWRLTYSHMHSLALFRRRLQTPEHFEEWMISLTAYLSLVSEGLGRITLALIMERVKTLHFVSRLLGMPLKPSVFVPLSYIDTDDFKVKYPSVSLDDPVNLASFITADGVALGMWITDTASSSAGRVMRPSVGGCQHLGSRRWLACDSEQDVQRMGRLGFEIKELSMPSLESQLAQALDVKDKGTTTTPRSKLGCKLEAMQTHSLALLKCYEDDDWTSVKEAQFTPHVTKLSACRAECSSAGDAVSLAIVDEWIDGLTIGKKFVKLYREVAKARHKDNKFSELAPVLLAFHDFAAKRIVRPSCSFKLLWYKALLWQANEGDVFTFQRGVNAMTANGLGEVFLRLNAGATSSHEAARLVPEVWLRGTLFNRVSASMDGLDAENLSETLVKVVPEVEAVAKTLSEDSGCSSSCASVIHDLTMYSTLLRAAMEPPTARPTDVKHALDHMSKPHMKELTAKLYQSAFGKHVISSATNLVQTSAKDEIADQKLNLALDSLSDPRLPALIATPGSESGADTTLTNFGIVADGSLVDHLGEALCGLIEALRLCTNSSMGDKAARVAEFFERLTFVIVFADKSECLYLQSVLARAEFGDALFGDLEPDDKDHVPVRVCTLAALGKDLDEHMIDGSSMEEFLDKVIEFLSSMPDPLRGAVNITDFISTMDGVRHNRVLREAIVECLFTLTCITEVPKDASAAFDDWSVNKAVGKGTNAFLISGMKLCEQVAKLDGKRFVGFPSPTHGEGNVDLTMDEGSRLGTLTATWRLTADLLELVCSLGMIALVEQRLQERLFVG